MDWKNIKYNGFRLKKFIAVYEFDRSEYVPWCFKLKITEDQDGNFWGSISLVRKNTNGNPQWINECAASERECIEKTLSAYWETLKDKPKGYDYPDEDFVWASHKEF